MKNADSDGASVSNSEQMKLLNAFMQQIQQDPDFAEKFRSFKESTSASEPKEILTVQTESPELRLKAIPLEDDNYLKLKNDFMIEERSYALASQSKFYEAISLLENLEYDDEPDIGIELLKAECYIQLGRETKAGKVIEKVEKNLLKSMYNVEDVVDLAKAFLGNRNFIRSLLLLRISSDLFLKSDSLSPNDKVTKMFRCISKMEDVLTIMLKPSTTAASSGEVIHEKLQKLLAPHEAGVEVAIQASDFMVQTKSKSKVSERTRVLARDYGLEVMEAMLTDMETIDGADPELKVLKMASSINYINLHSDSCQTSKAIKLHKYGIALLEKQFGKRANQHKIYSTLLCNLGVELYNCDRFKEAAEAEICSLKAKEYAMDYDSEESKMSAIRKVRKLLKASQNQLHAS